MGLASGNWLSVSECARRLGRSRAWVYGLLADGLLTHTTVKGLHLISEESIEKLLRVGYQPARPDVVRRVS